MERLTFDGNFCDIAQCTETRGGSFCEDGSCSQHKVWERLKEYESAGLTPREVHAYSDAEQNKRVVIFENQETLGRVADLICAEEQGRLVVLPCKVGDTVFVISKCENVRMSRDDDYLTGTGAVECPFESTCDTEDCDDNNIRIFETVLSDFWYGEENEKRPEMFLENIGIGYKFSDFGKTVFLTRQEAEKALEGMK